MNLIIKTLFRYIKRNYHILLSISSSVRYGNPSKDLVLIGVTGTSGKSTTSILIYHLLKSAGLKVGIISTLEAVAGNERIDTGFHVTTPDSQQLQKILYLMRQKGIKYVVMETSSQGLAQGRLGLLKFDFAVFTNIKEDHLDWHLNWNNYARAKAILIDKLKNTGVLIINKDDSKSYNYLKDFYNKNISKEIKLIEYSLKEEVKNVNESIEGISFDYKNKKFNLSILGKYNINNILASINVAENLNILDDSIISYLKTFSTINGRMQVIQKTPFSIIIDFAHNTDSLIQALSSIKDIIKINSKIICVFGSAGLRDVEKRYGMGKISAQMADLIIITAEDPRTEKLYDINNQILEGVVEANSYINNNIVRFKDHYEYISFIKNLNNIEDIKKTHDKLVFVFDEESLNSRYDAIDLAIKIANINDIVITEGKGHEQSLSFGNIEYKYSDLDAIMKSMSNVSQKTN